MLVYPVDDTLMGKKYCVRNTRRLFFHLVKKGNYKVLAAPVPPHYPPHSLLFQKKEKIIIVCLRSPERLWALSCRGRRSSVVVVVIVIAMVTGLVSLWWRYQQWMVSVGLFATPPGDPVSTRGRLDREMLEIPEANGLMLTSYIFICNVNFMTM